MTIDRQELITRAIELSPLVRRHADWSNRHRRQHPEVQGALAGAGLHRLAVPEDVGGIGADPVTMIKVIEAVSRADGSAGWALMIGIEGLGVASGYLPPTTISPLLADKPDTIMASALIPLGTATPVGGGYRVRGRWPFASGVHNADRWWGGCVVDDGRGTRPRPTIQAMIPRSEITIHDTWNVAGLAGTGSHDVEIDDVFVPNEHTTDALGGRPTTDDALFRIPLMARFACNKVGVSTGIARAALDTFIDLAKTKTPRGGRSTLAERPRAQLAIAEAEATLNGGRAWVLEIVEELWDSAVDDRPIGPELHAKLRLSCSNAARAAMEAVDMVHGAAGTTPNAAGHPLDRQFRDVHVVPQQLTVAPHMIETAGRVLLGLEPDLDVF
ncbi:MAG: acyl-CoA dehydrogenase family protein [Acidimicrobiales bacterium]